MDIVEQLKALIRANRIYMDNEKIADSSNEIITHAFIEIEDLRKELAQLRASREGYVLVPIEPTDAMWQSGFEVIDNQQHGNDPMQDAIMRTKATYKAMIEAVNTTEQKL
jgi:hypothetical protein